MIYTVIVWCFSKSTQKGILKKILSMRIIVGIDNRRCLSHDLVLFKMANLPKERFDAAVKVIHSLPKDGEY